MLFCPKCKSILIPSKDNTKKIVCNNCGYTLRHQKVLKIGEKAEKNNKVDIIDKTIENIKVFEKGKIDKESFVVM